MNFYTNWQVGHTHIIFDDGRWLNSKLEYHISNGIVTDSYWWIIDDHTNQPIHNRTWLVDFKTSELWRKPKTKLIPNYVSFRCTQDVWWTRCELCSRFLVLWFVCEHTVITDQCFWLEKFVEICWNSVEIFQNLWKLMKDTKFQQN